MNFEETVESVRTAIDELNTDMAPTEERWCDDLDNIKMLFERLISVHDKDHGMNEKQREEYKTKLLDAMDKYQMDITRYENAGVVPIREEGELEGFRRCLNIFCSYDKEEE